MIRELLTSSSLRICLGKGVKINFTKQYASRLPVEGGLIRTVIEHLQELTPPQVKHKLRIDTKIIRQPEARRVFLAIISEFLAQANKHAIEPTQYIRRVINFGLENGYPGHKNGRSFLVERCSDSGWPCFSKVASNSGHTKSLLAGGVLIVRDKLDKPSRARLEGLSGSGNDLEVDSGRGTWCNRVNFPGWSLSYTYLCFADTSALLSSRDSVSDKAWHFQFLSGLGEVSVTNLNEQCSMSLTCTSKVALKPIRSWSWSSLLKTRKKLCLKIDVAKESDKTMTPLVELGNDFISSRPTWSRQPANKSTAWPLLEARLAKPS